MDPLPRSLTFHNAESVKPDGDHNKRPAWPRRLGRLVDPSCLPLVAPRRCDVTDYEQMHGEPLEQMVPALAERVDTLEDRVAELEAKLRRLLSDEWRGPERP